MHIVLFAHSCSQVGGETSSHFLLLGYVMVAAYQNDQTDFRAASPFLQHSRRHKLNHQRELCFYDHTFLDKIEYTCKGQQTQRLLYGLFKGVAVSLSVFVSLCVAKAFRSRGGFALSYLHEGICLLPKGWSNIKYCRLGQSKLLFTSSLFFCWLILNLASFSQVDSRATISRRTKKPCVRNLAVINWY